MSLKKTLEENLISMKSHIVYYKDFPKPGILFKDVISLLNSADGVQLLAEILKQISHQFIGKVDCIAMLETRGFMFGPILALYLDVPCIPVSKKGNLPGPVIEYSYALEYGEDVLTVQLDSIKKGQKILVVDDFLATGGTLEAATNLIKQVGGEVVHGFVLMEKLELEGRKKLDYPVISLLSE